MFATAENENCEGETSILGFQIQRQSQLVTEHLFHIRHYTEEYNPREVAVFSLHAAESSIAVFLAVQKRWTALFDWHCFLSLYNQIKRERTGTGERDIPWNRESQDSLKHPSHSGCLDVPRIANLCFSPDMQYWAVSPCSRRRPSLCMTCYRENRMCCCQGLLFAAREAGGNGINYYVAASS